MGIASAEEQKKRSRGAAKVFVAFFLSIPVIGWFVAPMVAGSLGLQIFAKSSTRLTDFGRLLAATLGYLITLGTLMYLGMSLWTISIALFIVTFIGLKAIVPRLEDD